MKTVTPAEWHRHVEACRVKYQPPRCAECPHAVTPDCAQVQYGIARGRLRQARPEPTMAARVRELFASV